MPRRRNQQRKKATQRQQRAQGSRSRNKQPPPVPRGGNRRSRRSKMPSGMGDLFDPRNPVLVPSIVSEGAAFPISGSTIRNLSMDTSVRTIVAYTNTGHAGTVMSWVNTSATPGSEVNTIPLLAAADTAGGPTSGRSMKGGLSIVNRTQVLNMGGQVAVLNSTQRVSLPAQPSSMTAAQWSAFMDEIVAHPKTRIYNGADFKKGKTFIAHPLDQTEYVHYEGWHGTLGLNEFWQRIAIWSDVNPEPRPMSTIFLVFEPNSVNNVYEFKTRSAFYTRWPLNTVPGQAHRPVPTAPAAVINAHRDHAEATSHLARAEEATVAMGLTGAAAWLARGAQVARGAAMVGEGIMNADLAVPLLAGMALM